MMHATVICIFIKNKIFNMCAIYCTSSFYWKKEDYIHLFDKLINNFVIGGDFKAKHMFWESRLVMPKG